MEEIWKPIPDFDKYWVSNLGNVKSFKYKAPRILKPSTKRRGGYKLVILSKEGKCYPRHIHQLVSLAFIGPCPESMEVCHEDDTPSNNHVDNLRYDTHTGNYRNAMRVKLHNQIRIEYYFGDIERKNLAKKYGLPYRKVCNILREVD